MSSDIVVWACADCWYSLANGEEPFDMTVEQLSAWNTNFDKNVGDYEVSIGRSTAHCGHDFDEDDYDSLIHLQECETKEFSWTPCELCESTLGGARYAVTLWKRN